jgi:hypothetical protein
LILHVFIGIEKHGVGNWKTISESHCVNKTTKQVEEHYWELYMGTHGYCLPAQVMWRDTFVSTDSFCPCQPKVEEGTSSSSSSSSSSSAGADAGVAAAAGPVQAQVDLYRTAVNEGYQRGEVIRRDEGLAYVGQSKASSNKDKQDLREKLAMLPGSDLPGFYPLRGDFDNEYEVRTPPVGAILCLCVCLSVW